jgi:hypothetical protein
MSTATKTVSPPMLRIWHGCGEILDVPAEAIAGIGGTNLEALQKIATEVVHDPDLLRTLQDDHLVLQRLGDSDDPDDVQQEELSRTGDFTSIADRCQTRTENLAASIRHDGGAVDSRQ